ncbi:MAG: response regulator transcription factor [Chloroflexi bacterium]|nr:response regulator transcription factor [Chloroflexota bacterium]
MIRLAVVDDHPAIAAAIEAAIHDRIDIILVGTVTSAAAAADLVTTTMPDVLLCDLWLDGEAAGLDVLALCAGAGRTSRAGPSTPPRVLVLSGFDQPSFLRAAFEGGAAGYLSKSSTVADIIDAVVAVAAGETRFPPVTLRALRDAPRRPSARELGAIRLLARGASNDEIAVGLGISVKTVESHLRRLFGRYGVLSRTELAMLAVREGWVASEP